MAIAGLFADQELSVLLREYDRVCVEIRAIESQNDKIVGFGLTIIGAGGAYGLAQHLSQVFVVLPFMFLAVFFYAVLQYHNIFWYGGYNKALEERINHMIGVRVLTWESNVFTKQRARVHFANLSLVTIYIILLISTSIYSSFQVFTAYGELAALAETGANVILLVALLVALRNTFRAFDQAYRVTRENFQGASDA